MNKKLWIFGDSFGSYSTPTDPRTLTKSEIGDLEHSEPDKSSMWFFALARLLGCDECIAIAIPGSSIDVMQFYFEQSSAQINKNDYIICIHTEPSRRWFVPELPEMTNFINFIDSRTMDVDWPKLENSLFLKINMNRETKNRICAQLSIAKDYALRIARKDLESLYGASIISWFKEYQSKGYNLVNVPAYTCPAVEKYNMYFETTGDLYTISMNEFQQRKNFTGQLSKNTAEQALKRFIEITEGWDGRVSHLTLHNHGILANKLYNSLLNKSPLNLTRDFKHNFITEKNYQEYDLYQTGPNGRGERVCMYYAPYTITDTTIEFNQERYNHNLQNKINNWQQDGTTYSSA